MFVHRSNITFDGLQPSAPEGKSGVPMFPILSVRRTNFRRNSILSVALAKPRYFFGADLGMVK